MTSRAALLPVLSFPQPHNSLYNYTLMFLVFHHLTVCLYFLLASENVFSNGYSTVKIFIAMCDSWSRSTHICDEQQENTMLRRVIFSKWETARKCVKTNTRKLSAINRCHSLGTVWGKYRGDHVPRLKKRMLLKNDQPANHSGCNFLLSLFR